MILCNLDVTDNPISLPGLLYSPPSNSPSTPSHFCKGKTFVPCSFSSTSLQIDLRFEAKNLERFRLNFQEVDYVKFPIPLHPFVTRNILVETFEVGVLLLTGIGQWLYSLLPFIFPIAVCVFSYTNCDPLFALSGSVIKLVTSGDGINILGHEYHRPRIRDHLGSCLEFQGRKASYKCKNN